MVQAVLNAFRIPDLRRKLLLTLGLLLVFRLEAHVPVPNVDHATLALVLKSSGLLQLFNLLSGGGLQNFSIVALGVYPYITASIVMQLLIGVIPALTELQKEGEYGRNKINQYTRMLTVPLALIQGYGQMVALNSQSNTPIFTHFGLFQASTFLPTIEVLISLAAGTIFAMWLGELITENGIGNGISLIIFAGIVSRLIPDIQGQGVSGNWSFLLVLGIFALVVIAVIVFVSQGTRQIPVQYAKRIRGGRMYQGQSTHIPLRVNSAGMIPLIFAQSIVILPVTVATYFRNSGGWVQNVAVALSGKGTTESGGLFTPDQIWYWVIYFVLVVAFTYFYTAVTFQQQNLPESLQKNGGFIPGHRPGPPTARYLNYVLNRITLAGAFFLAAIAVLPFFINLIVGGSSSSIATQTFSSTAVLIVVGVAIDTLRQLEAQLMMRQYQGFIR
jgi:preprotein translocase subunit SecY